jgi:hypothetical protein
MTVSGPAMGAGARKGVSCVICAPCVSSWDDEAEAWPSSATVGGVVAVVQEAEEAGAAEAIERADSRSSSVPVEVK